MNASRVVSVNVGRPRTLRAGDREVRSAIFKEPVAAGARLAELGFEGDEQADRKVHGGPFQAAYLYSTVHYAFWKDALGRDELPFGFFGENLTVEGMIEADVRVGDVYAMGEARVRVTRPRGPCFKLAARVGRPHFVTEFLATGRLGSYLQVVQPGHVSPGDAIDLLERPGGAVTMAELVAALHDASAAAALLERVAVAPGVDPKHRERIEKRLALAREEK